MDNIKTIAWGLLLLLTIALAHTICYELDEAIERDTSSNSRTGDYDPKEKT